MVSKRNFNAFQYVFRSHRNILHEKYITFFFSLGNNGILINSWSLVKVLHPPFQHIFTECLLWAKHIARSIHGLKKIRQTFFHWCLYFSGWRQTINRHNKIYQILINAIEKNKAMGIRKSKSLIKKLKMGQRHKVGEIYHCL